MATRLPNHENEEAIRSMLGWDQAMAALQRNILEQQNQQHQNSLNQAAALAARLTRPTSLANQSIPPLWPYNLPSTAELLAPQAAAAAAASLASLSNPTNSYLNHLQNLHNPEGLLSFQQNLLLLEQIQQQRQLIAANPHLLMAVAAAQNTNGSISPQAHLLNNSSNQSISNVANGVSNGGGSSNGLINNNTSLLATVNPNMITNQHQDSLVDQHFRRSLGEDYNQIMTYKSDGGGK